MYHVLFLQNGMPTEKRPVALELKTKSYIAEAPSNAINDEAFKIHIICPNCMMPQFNNVDFWQLGKGFALSTVNYFGKNHKKLSDLWI